MTTKLAYLICTGPECDRVAYSSDPDLCKAHYQQMSRKGVLKPLVNRGPRTVVICSGPECVREAVSKGLCAAHNHQRKSGKALKPLRTAVAKKKLDPRARNEHGHKQCTRCREWMALDNYTTHSTKPDLLSLHCVECQRDVMLQRKYKLTLTEFNTLLAQQGGTCATCPRTDSLVVDHDHSCCAGDVSCGKCVRGILCHQCNSVLGLAGDNPEVLRALVTYVTQSNNGTL